MKFTQKQLRRIIKEAQWGNFTGGAAPLDMPMRDSGPVPKDQLRKMADIFMNDMGMSPEEVLEKPEFAEQGITDLKQLEENKMRITKRQLKRIIKEELRRINESDSRPLAVSGGPGKRIPGYHFDRVHQVHVRDDYNPRTDYSDELDKAIQKLHNEELRNI